MRVGVGVWCSYLTMTALLGGGLAAALVLMPLIYIGGHVRCVSSQHHRTRKHRS